MACKLSNSNNCSAIYVNKPQQIFKLSKNIAKLKEEGYSLLNNICNNSKCIANKKVLKLTQMHYGENSELAQMIEMGFFPHFGDLENGLRLSIEHEIRNHNIQCVICTSTLAEGVNLPIKYLFLSTLQDVYGQMISTRKFQNLIGRTARSGVYTEGSLICTDRKYFDEKRKNSEQWGDVVKLFDASKSEHCNSAILQIFESLPIPYTGKKLKGSWLLSEFLKSYSNSVAYNIDDWVEAVYLLHVNNYIKASSRKDIRQKIYDVILARLNQIKQVVDFVEILILEECAHGDENNDEEERVNGLAKNTLAYKMADEKNQNAIVEMFNVVWRKVSQISNEKCKIYAKAMSELDILNIVDNYLKDHSEMYELSIFCEETWIKNLVNIAEECISFNHQFNKLDLQVRLIILRAWVNGDTYQYIMNATNIKLDSVIKICNKISYSLNLLISNILELIPQYKAGDKTDEKWKSYIDEINLFQKRVRYGLKKAADIAVYEFGYADRIIAKDIGDILETRQTMNKVEGYKSIIKLCDKEIKERLDYYPNYFRDVVQL